VDVSADSLLRALVRSQDAPWPLVVGGGLVTALMAVVTAMGTLRQRRREHRWRQAELGKRVLDELFADPFSRDACYMLDVERRQYPALRGADTTVSFAEVRDALRLARERVQLQKRLSASDDLSPKHIFICDCFDVLFYRLNRLEHFIENKLVRFGDVVTPLEYYAKRIQPYRQEFEDHMGAFQHDRAVKLLERYWDPWLRRRFRWAARGATRAFHR
jgi:hypothetical protein